MDLDPFDDLFPDPASKPGARAGGRFQPKAKAKPRPRNPAPAPDPPSTQSVPVITSPSSNQLSGRSEKQDGQKESSDEHPFSVDINVADWQSCFEKYSGGENGGDNIVLESFYDFNPQSATTTSTVTESSLPSPEKPTILASDGQNADPELSKTANRCTSLEGPAQLGTLTGEEGAVFNDSGDFHIESRTPESEDADDFPSLDIMSKSTSRSGQRIGKIQPRPKLQPCQMKQNAVDPNPDVIESGSLAEDTQSIPSQTEYMVEGSIPSFPADDVIDFSSTRFSDSIHTDLTSDFQVNEETTDWMGTSHTAAEKSGRRNVLMAQDPLLEHQNGSTSAPEAQVCRSSERLRKRSNTFELLDESEDKDLDDDNGLEKEDNHNIDTEYVVENESLKVKPRSRSKKSAAEKEKPVRKRKKADGETVEPTKAPKKKFSHSTRRNRRYVDPELLKLPEDEIDFHSMPLKTRIRLAEHKEKMAKNQSATSETPLMNQGFTGYHDEEEASQGKDSGDEYEDSMAPETVGSINYRTYMKMTPRIRWSKQDTELFYEVLQQFGTDLTMIAECFPGRTRHQIKLKYKSEERRNPLRLHDALATRSSDSSHYQVIIERLQITQKPDDNSDDQINFAGEKAEEVAVNTNEVAQSELPKNEVQGVEKEETAPATESSPKPDDSEDDDFLWSQYKSEI